MADYKKEWFAKAQIDYFSPFISLWLSCNSWYNFHYSLKNDREHVNKVKSDFNGSNKLYKEFERVYMGASSKEQTAFFANLELLHYSLNGRNIKGHNLLGFLGFDNVLVDYANKGDSGQYESLIINNARTKSGKIKSGLNGIDIGGIVLLNDCEKVFAGLFEIIYQVRCLLIHGDLSPTEDNHEIVKYCYLILLSLMKPFCT